MKSVPHLYEWASSELSRVIQSISYRARLLIFSWVAIPFDCATRHNHHWTLVLRTCYLIAAATKLGRPQTGIEGRGFFITLTLAISFFPRPIPPLHHPPVLPWVWWRLALSTSVLFKRKLKIRKEWPWYLATKDFVCHISRTFNLHSNRDAHIE